MLYDYAVKPQILYALRIWILKAIKMPNCGFLLFSASMKTLFIEINFSQSIIISKLWPFINEEIMYFNLKMWILFHKLWKLQFTYRHKHLVSQMQSISNIWLLKSYFSMNKFKRIYTMNALKT